MNRIRRGAGIEADPNVLGLTRVPAGRTLLPRPRGGLCVCPGVGTRWFVGGTPACPNSGGTLTTLLSDVALADRTTGHSASVSQGTGATVAIGVVVSLVSAIAPTTFRITAQYLDTLTVTVRGWNGTAWVPATLAIGVIPGGAGSLAWIDITANGNGTPFQCFLVTFTDSVAGDSQAPFINVTDVRLYNGGTLLN